MRAPASNILLWLIALAALLALPWVVTSEYYVNIASQIVIAAILALSLNLLIGFGGMASRNMRGGTATSPSPAARRFLRQTRTAGSRVRRCCHSALNLHHGGCRTPKRR